MDIVAIVAAAAVGFGLGVVWGMRRRSPTIFRLGRGVGAAIGLAVGIGVGMRLGRGLPVSKRLQAVARMEKPVQRVGGVSNGKR